MTDAIAIAVQDARITHLDRRLDEAMETRDKALEVALASRDKALAVALESLNAHLGVMNEFRNAMSDQAGRFITRAEHEEFGRRIADIQLSAQTIHGEYVPRVDMAIQTTRLENIERRMAELQGRYAMVALMFGALATVAGLVAVWWPKVVPLAH